MISGEHWRRRPAILAIAFVTVVLAVVAGALIRPFGDNDPRGGRDVAVNGGGGRMASSPVLAVHFDRGRNPLLGSRGADLAKVAEAFNAVLVPYGDEQLLKEARAHGLKVYLTFDQDKEFAAGQDISPTVVSVVQFVKAHRDAITAIRVADRVNQGLAPDQTLGYLRATGGVLHQQLPGLPVFVDLADPELTCDLPGQSSCSKPRRPDYRYQTNAELLRIYRSGYVDGFMLANGLARSDNDFGGRTVREIDAVAQAAAWRKARAMFPRPFLLFARVALLSFPQQQYPADAAQAALATRVFVQIPLEQGADGVDLWAWNRRFGGTHRTFLDKGGGDNPLWRSMVGVAASLGAHGDASE
jgi:hypothetical protein